MIETSHEIDRHIKIKKRTFKEKQTSENIIHYKKNSNKPYYPINNDLT